MSAPIPVSKLLDLTGQSVVVTGGGKGIGRAIALRFSEAGASVLVADIERSAAEEVVRRITESGGRGVAVVADVSKVDEAKKLASRALETFGRLDVLVNNAGIFPFAPVESVDEALWDRVLSTNLKSAFFASQAAATAMTKSEGPKSIVNIASIDALHPTGSLAHYDASKGGMLMLTRSLAFELGRKGIRVNGVAPGSIRTPGAAEILSTLPPGTAGELEKAFATKVPLGRSGEADEIATAVLCMASPAMQYVTGATLVVDGGFLLS